MLRKVLKLIDWPIRDRLSRRTRNHYSTLPSSQNQFENLSSLKKLETLQLLFNFSIMHEKYIPSIAIKRLMQLPLTNLSDS